MADCSVPTEIVALLGKQLDRCGPEQLTCPICPGCPELRCPVPGPAYGAFAAGAAVGILLTLLIGVRQRLQRQPAAAAQPLDDELFLALGAGPAQPQHQDGGEPAATPASLRARRQ